MLKKALLCAVCATSFCFADNFLIDQYPDKEKKAEQEEQSKLPQRVVIEDVNPSSELGQLIGVMLKNEQKKAAVATVVEQKPKKTVTKKKTTKKKTTKKTTKKKVASNKNITEVKKEVVMEIKSEEATKVSEPEKKEAEHNENNSSLKKVSSSKACD
jgi:hypothetical protein